MDWVIFEPGLIQLVLKGTKCNIFTALNNKINIICHQKLKKR